MGDKLQISWDDLSHEKVDQKLKEQEAVSSTQAHYEQTNIVAPPKTRRLKFLYNAIVYLSLFGFLGGVFGWAIGDIVPKRPTQQKEANELIAQYTEIVTAQQKIKATDEEIRKATNRVRIDGEGNPYFQIEINDKLTEDEKAAQTAAQLERDQGKDFIANMLLYGASGVMIAMMLAIADSVMERNINGAMIYGAIGAVVGIVGGVVVALVVNRIHEQMLPMQEVATMGDRILTHTICWGLLGLFLASTPGLILRNAKRLLVGMVGGLVGGLIGGVLYAPVGDAVGNEHLSRLLAITCIGTIAGFACGVIENVVKTGWLKVESGLIAGKQFVLYRNPTFIGSHPMSHIYLFNDPTVGRRHACIHLIGNGYEIEDLPLGARTYVNGKPVTRLRLKRGDTIQVGSTQFLFHERSKSV